MPPKTISIARGIGIVLVVLGHVNGNINVGPHVYLYHMPLFFFLGGLQYEASRPLRQVLKFTVVDIWLYAVIATVGYSGLSFLIHGIWGVQYQSFSDLSLWHYTTEIWTRNGDHVQLALTVWFLLAYGSANLLTFAVLRWVPKQRLAAAACVAGSAGVISGIGLVAPLYHSTGLWWLNYLSQSLVGAGFMLLGAAFISSSKIQLWLMTQKASFATLLVFLWLAHWIPGAYPSMAWSDYAEMPSWLYLLVALAGCLTVLNISRMLSVYSPNVLAEMGSASKTIMIHHLAVFAALNLVFVSFGLMEPSEVDVYSKGLLWLTWPFYMLAGLFFPLWVYRTQRRFFPRQLKSRPS